MTGVLSDDRMKLDYVLGLKIEDFLERRLQTQVIHHNIRLFELDQRPLGVDYRILLT